MSTPTRWKWRRSLWFAAAGVTVCAAVVTGVVIRFSLQVRVDGGIASAPRPLARLEPATGQYYGVNLDWEHDSASAYAQRLGRAPAVYVAFVHFPLQPDDEPYLDSFVEQVLQQRGRALLTLEPTIDLQAVTEQMATDFVQRLAGYNERGVPVLVRFAQEMNGSWYSWGQQPTAYIRAFRLVADHVHRQAPESAMLWAPNYGSGYPFPGGPYEAEPDSPDFGLLDTNHDGKLDSRDDMYAPYYPGDDAVDWVGMTLYHWGDAWPGGKNIVPEPDKFVAQLSGTYNGASGDDRGLPNFYNIYSEVHGKPMAIPETAALYNTSIDTGDSELDIKRAWWRQVFSPEVALKFPDIKLINWFEWRKPEAEVGGAIIDWTATINPTMRDAFVSDLSAQPQLIFAPGAPGSPTPQPIPAQTQVPAGQSSTILPAPALEAAAAPTATTDFRRSVEFSGYQWWVRSAAELQGPGPNFFSDAPDHVWVDGEGRLHLRVAASADGRWYCVEVESSASPGYGTYQFTLDSRVDNLDPNVVAGFFTWSDDPAENHRELDIEFGVFGQPTDPGGRYTVQPYTSTNNVSLFKPPSSQTSAHAFEWSQQQVVFQSWTGVDNPSTGRANIIASHAFVGGVPEHSDEHVHMNVWLDAGKAPTDSEPVEIVVKQFAFTPAR
jgi:hypothetical protein